MAGTSEPADDSPVQIGVTFTTGSGEHAIIRGVTGNDVWVEIRDPNGANLGTLRFPMAAVETALTRKAQEHDAEPLWRAGMRERAERAAGATTPPIPPTYSPPRNWEKPPAAAVAATPVGATASNIQKRVMSWWRGLTKRWRMGVIAGAIATLILVLFGSGACENSQYRQCVKDGMQALDYYQGGGSSATKDAIKRSCERMYGKY